MSTTIDERVVSMQFDNKHFETNVRTSLGTLDKLKQSLRLTEASKGLENVSSAAKKLDMSGISNAVENVRLKFSALEVMAVTTLANITNSAVNAGKRIAAAFTIEPIRTGLAEYETQINAVQTILANTESKGTTLDDVNAALDTLNKYADKTIYNFTEMTRNIGTFTAAGIDLDTSVNAIQGIANLAAVSGSNAQQASTAMYQLSQALASGTVKLMDWNSVVNAGMGGQVFQDALKETARVHGVKIDEMIKKQGSFRETLQEGWLTSEILTETLQKFTLTTEGLTKEQIEANKQMLKAKGYTDDQIESIFKLGETATNAATKVKTFTQLMDTLKEAAQSGWTQTWELVIGDFDQAKELWTNVSDVFGEMINKSAESRNTLLEGALTSNWDKLIKQLNEVGIQTSDFQKSVSETAEKHGKNLDELIEKYGSFEKAVRSGAISTDILKESLKGAKKEAFSLDLIKGPLKRNAQGEDVKQLEAALKSLGYDLVGKRDKKDYSSDGYYGLLTEAAVKDFQKKQGLKVTGRVDEKTLEALRKATKSTAEEVGNLNESVFDLIDGVDKLGGREMLLDSFKNIFKSILNIIAPIKSAFRNIFPPITVEQLYSAIEAFKNITEKFKLSQEQANRLRRTFKGLFAALDIVKTITVGALGAGFKVLSKVFTVVGDKVLIVTAKIGDAIVKFRNWLFENNRLTKGFSAFINTLKTVAKTVKNAIKTFLEIPEVQQAIEKVKKAFSDAFRNVGDYFGEGIARIKDFVKRLMSMDSISLDNLSSIFKDLKKNVIDYFFKFDFKGIFDNIKNALKGFKDNALKNLDGAGEKFAWLKEKLSEFVSFICSKIPAAIAILMGAMLIKAVSGLGKTMQTMAEAFSGFSESITGFIDTVGKSISEFANAKAFEAKTNGILNLAKAIGILAVSIAVLTFLDQKKMWSAVGAIAALAVVLGALSFVSTKIGGTLDFGKSSVSIILLAGALFILVTCLKDLEKLNGDNLLRDIAILGGMAIGLAVVAGILGKVAPQLSANSFVFIALAAGIKIMVSALTDIDKMKFDNIGRTVGVLLGVVAGLALIAVVSSKISLGSTVGIIAIAIGLKVLIGAMEDISNLNAEKMKNNIGSFITIFGALAVLIVASKFAGKYAASAGIAILAISAALILIAGAIRILGTMGKSIMKKATTSIAEILMVFAAITALSKFAGKNAITAGIGILAMSAAILILTGAIYLLKDIDPSGLKNATIAISTIIGMFTLLVASTKFMTSSVKPLVAMVGALVILTGAIYILSNLDIDKTLKIAASLSALILSLSAMVLVLSKIPITAAAKGVISLGIIAAGLAGVIVGFVKLTKYLSGDLPAIGKNLSEFMRELGPFIDGSKLLSGPVIAGITGLADMIWTLTKANMVEGISEFMGRESALTNFGKQLKPFGEAIADFAGALVDVKVNPKALTSLVESVKTLAEAANLLPKSNAVITPIGGYISISGLESFGSWIKTVMPVLKDFAIDISGAKLKQSDYNGIKSICEAVKSLAEAANLTPSAKAAAGLGKFKGLTGAGVYIDYPMLSGFATWLTGVLPAISEFSTDLKNNKLNTSDYSNVKSICEAVKTLAEAADSAPSIELAVGFAKKFGGGGYISVPLLNEFTNWVSGVLPVVSGFAVDLKGAELKKTDYNGLSSVCEAVKTIAEAAGSAPDVEIAAAITKFGVGGYVSVPLLNEFVTWIKDVVPVVKDFTIDISKENISKNDYTVVGELCKSVLTLSESVTNVPSIEGMGGFATAGPIMGAFAKFSIPNLDSFSAWIKEVVPVIKNFAIDISEADISKNDYTAVGKICEAVSTLSQAVTNVPGTEFMFGAGGVGPVIAAFLSIKTPDLRGFADWIVDVAPELVTLATGISGISVDNFDFSKVTTVCEAAKTLAEAAELAPKEETFKALGLATYVKSTDLDSFATWLKDTVDVLKNFAIEVSSEEIKIDPGAVIAVATAGKLLGEMANAIPQETEVLWGLWTTTSGDSWDNFGTNICKFGEAMSEFSASITGKVDPSAITAVSNAGLLMAEMASIVTSTWITPESFDSFDIMINDFADTMVSFSDKVNKIDDASVTAASSAGGTLADMLTKLSGFAYATVDITSFGTKLDEIATAISDFSNNLAGVDPSSAIQKVNSVVSLLTKVGITDFKGAGSFVSALETIGKTSIDGFADKFINAKDRIYSATAKMLSGVLEAASKSKDAFIKIVKEMGTKAVSEIRDKYGDFKSAGEYVAKGLANGIADKRWMSEDQARRLARAAIEAAKRELGEHSPSKVFYKIGDFAGLGFINGLDRYVSKAYNSSAEVADSARKGLSGAVSKISDVIQNGIDTQPTIRPVVDLSGVATGANAIYGMFRMSPSLSANVGSISAMMNRNQNGVSNADVVSAIKDLGKKIGRMSGDTYSVNGVTYDDGSNVSNAVRDLTRAIKMERRV